MPVTPRYGIKYGQLDEALTLLDSGVAFGSWAPKLSATVVSSRTFGYYGGFNASGVFIPDGTIVIPDGTTKCIQRTAAGVVSADAAFDLVAKVPMAIATAAGGVLTHYADARDVSFWGPVAQVTALYGGSNGDIPYSNGTSPVILSVGGSADGYVLTLAGGVPTWAAPTGGGGGESLFSKTVLQLHMDGTNGSTTFTDVKGHTVTPSGNAQISTAQSKFGGASGLFDGTGDFLTVTAAHDFNLSGFFSIQVWVRTTQNTRQYATLVERDNGSFTSGSWALLFNNGSASDGKVGWYHAGVAPSGLVSTTAINDGAWHSIGVFGFGNTYLLFIDGVQEGEISTGTAFGVNTANILVGKSVNATREFNGYMDELRIVKGGAAHTRNYTPETSAFADS